VHGTRQRHEVGWAISATFRHKLSGSARTDRPGLAAMLDYARDGDTVVVTAIDRLGRSVAEIRVTNVAQPISVQ
jgi:DNA invertase Pin-like site-specific DNA recombinase